MIAHIHNTSRKLQYKIDRVRLAATNPAHGTQLWWVEGRTNPLNETWEILGTYTKRSTATAMITIVSQGGNFILDHHRIMPMPKDKQ